MRKGKIYKITNIITKKIYVGQTIQSLKVRFRRHKNDAKNGKKGFLFNSIRKHGISKFKIKLIELCDVQLLDDRESFYISRYKSTSSKGYNLLPGGRKTMRGINHFKADKKEYKFYHISGIVEKLIISDFILKYKLDKSAVHRVLKNKQTHVKNWYSDLNKMLLYTFKHKEGIIEEGVTKRDFKNKYKFLNGSITNLIIGNAKTHKGWSVEIYDKSKRFKE